MLRVKPELIEKIRGATKASDLFEHLQGAIELEHATIPLYLSAGFSIKEGKNREAREIILSVANQEMLHMTIACNVLNAIGGSPVIDKPGFIPLYPGPLPLDIHEGLTVTLQKATREHVYGVFMTIEEPERPLKLPVKAAAATMPASQFVTAVVPDDSFATIGDFYKAIKDQIIKLGDAIFTHPSHAQVVDNTWFPADQLFAVTDVKSACAALDVIVEQGEGTTTTPFDGIDGELAHYYRLAQIVYGRRLVEDHTVEERYSYSGSAVPLDPAGIWNLYPNAKAVDYEPNGRARIVVERFNYSYTCLLRALHELFNGGPTTVADALAVMYEMRLCAGNVVATPVAGTEFTAAPTFEYTPILT